jgi:hypothetical protein
MRTRSSARWLLVVTSVLALPIAAPAEEEANSVQWYAVELVLFDQRGATNDDNERWPQQPDLPSVTQRLVPIGEAEQAAGFSALADNARNLNGIRRELASTGGYQVLAHIGWRQPGLAKEVAPAIALPLDWMPPAEARIPSADTANAADNPPLTLDALNLGDERARRYAKRANNPFMQVPAGTRLYGTIRAYRERYLHLEMDLRFDPSGWQGGSTPQVEPSHDKPSLTDTPGTYVFRQQRRLRSDEIHYLDHPVLGIIAIIRPIDRPQGTRAPTPQASPD